LFAGADALLRDRDLPDVPIAKAGNPAGDAMMNETVLLHVLRHHRYMPAYLQAQARCEWIKLPLLRASERKIGVMGLGTIGLAAAKALAGLGFQVAGWVRQPRPSDEIEVFSGRDQFNEFLVRSEILVNLLPLTAETRGIICADMLRRLPAGAAVINLGRGDHVVEADLIAALDSGHLAAATLDVFPVEPLPSDSPLWRHPNVTVMPHVSRRLVPEDMVRRICDSIRKIRAGIPLTQLIDPNRGY
jgi:glyoxylate/hydroxypyruvate reductase A